MRFGRHLAPLLGAAMAGVAATSLVIFSLLAGHTALDDSGNRAVRPRAAVHDTPPDHLTIAPSATGDGLGAPATVGSPALFRAAPALALVRGRAATEPQAPIPSDALASLDIPRVVTVEVSRPLVDVSPRPSGTPTPDPDEPRDGPTCPGPPDKQRPKGEHPHGGPPACGNPHGTPPGYAKSGSKDGDDSGAASDEGSPSSTGAKDKERSGDGPPKVKTPEPAAREPEPEPQDRSGGGTPPGHAKKPDDRPAHPHGGPPGKSKKTK